MGGVVGVVRSIWWHVVGVLLPTRALVKWWETVGVGANVAGVCMHQCSPWVFV